MKDFYDLYILLGAYEWIDQQQLEDAIKATFDRRKTPLPPNHPLFDEAFAEDPQRNAQWTAFLKKTKLDTRPAFGQVRALIQDKLGGIYDSLAG